MQLKFSRCLLFAFHASCETISSLDPLTKLFSSTTAYTAVHTQGRVDCRHTTDAGQHRHVQDRLCPSTMATSLIGSAPLEKHGLVKSPWDRRIGVGMLV